ncbi:MAG TPA: response regulator [Bacteroidetes bacterium]|nr:response regulator [Bacteroidota bacterium]
MRILIVDDERDVEQLYRMSFRREVKNGIVDLEFAFSAKEAFEKLLLLHPMDVVLVLSDINMPGMSGFDLLKMIRDKFPELRVYMVSAYSDSDNMNTARTLGANDFLTKPVDFSLLKSKITELKGAA